MVIKKLTKELETIVAEINLMQRFPEKCDLLSKNKIRKLVKEKKLILADFIGKDGVREVNGYVIRKDRLGSVLVYTMASWAKAKKE